MFAITKNKVGSSVAVCQALDDDGGPGSVYLRQPLEPRFFTAELQLLRASFMTASGDVGVRIAFGLCCSREQWSLRNES